MLALYVFLNSVKLLPEISYCDKRLHLDKTMLTVGTLRLEQIIGRKCYVFVPMGIFDEKTECFLSCHPSESISLPPVFHNWLRLSTDSRNYLCF